MLSKKVLQTSVSQFDRSAKIRREAGSSKQGIINNEQGIMNN